MGIGVLGRVLEEKVRIELMANLERLNQLMMWVKSITLMNQSSVNL